MQKSGEKLNLYFELILYVLALGCFFYFWFQGNYEEAFQGVLIITVLLMIRLLLKRIEAVVFPLLRFSILFFILLTMILAKEFDFYGIIPNLDKIEHLLSGVILTFVGLVIHRALDGRAEASNPSKSIIILFSVIFAIAMAGLWEIYEFSTDQIFGFNSQNGSLVDTMGDIICGTIGGGMAGIYLALKKEEKD